MGKKDIVRIYGAKREDDRWRIRTNEELKRIFGESDIITGI